MLSITKKYAINHTTWPFEQVVSLIDEMTLSSATTAVVNGFMIFPLIEENTDRMA